LRTASGERRMKSIELFIASYIENKKARFENQNVPFY